MLQLRVIEESHSAWSSPIVLVPKPPLPHHPGPHQGVLAGAAHQNRSGEDGVCDPGGSISIYGPSIRRPWRTRYVPEDDGPTPSASTGVRSDDIIIHSASWDVHLRQLRVVLGELRKAGLMANPAKCRLGLEETSYLCYQVGRGNVRRQESKVAAIRYWPRPTTKKQVKYQRFIPGFATLASPLNDLTRKSPA